MTTAGISRNIPASQRHLILERAADIAGWPGSRSIRSVIVKGRLRITYEGQGGYACLRMHPDDDLERRLVAIDRLIAHDKEISAISASMRQSFLECDFDPESGCFLDEDAELPIWAWIVPEEMAIAYRNDIPEGIRGRIDRELAISAQGDDVDLTTTTPGGTTYVIKSSGSSYHTTMRAISLFSVRTGSSFVSWNASRHYMKVAGQLPEAVISGMEGRRIADYVTHPLVHPETVIRKARRDKGGNGTVLDLWRQGAVLAAAPIRELDDIERINREYERLRR